MSTVMLKRWQSHNKQLPAVDLYDIAKDCPLISQEEASEDSVSQAAPEYSQVAYLRLRSLEEVYQIRNYLDPKCNPKFALFLQ